MFRTAFVILIAFASFSVAITPPTQPKSGPGGQEYSHAAVTKFKHKQGATEFWLYEPDSPKPNSAPVVVFLHGWGATNPAIYGAWLDHLVKRGNIVIYPRYQESFRTPLKDLTPNAIQAIQSAIQLLQTEDGHVKPELSHFAVAGHSAGGIISANVAALAKEKGLPQVLALMPIEPARTWNPTPRMNIPLEDLGKISSNTLLLSIAGDKDFLAKDTDAKRIYKESVLIPSENKDFITFISDSHGTSSLNANHSMPTGPDKAYDNGERRNRETSEIRNKLKARIQTTRNENIENFKMPSESSELILNALDFYGTWKLFDALCDTAFYGKNREYALGNTPQQRFMGVWSDGQAVKEMQVSDNP
ncbi:MAG TPA: alpha/beta hydrolase [Acidobacteriota bacterium]|nr:alpha/beta hydrolase [Acidobacteriota bacterium]